MKTPLRNQRARFFGWLFNWRTLRRLLAAMAAFATAVVLFHNFEHWRGKRAWEYYREEQEARGVTFDWSAFIPPEVPAHENFAATPSFAALFDAVPGGQWDGTVFQKVAVERWVSSNDGWRIGRKMSFRKLLLAARDEEMSGDYETQLGSVGGLETGAAESEDKQLAAIDTLSRAEQAAALLARLESYDSLLEELRAASRRPHSRFNLAYDREDPFEILLPHLAPLKHLCQVLSVRACASLEIGRVSDAAEDLDLLFHLADAIKTEPMIISYLVRMICLEAGLQAVWEGLAQRAWSEEQLRTLQERLAAIDALSEALRSIHAERAIVTSRNVPLMRKQDAAAALFAYDSAQPMKGAWLLNAYPRGWLYLEQLNYSRRFDGVLHGIDPETRRVQPAIIRMNEAALQEKTPRTAVRAILEKRIFADLLMPNVPKVHARAAIIQSAINQALIACALERYHLAHGTYPESLEALAPGLLQTIPHDIITGQSLKYRRNEDGRFILYSVGWNETDDGGLPVSRDQIPGDVVFRGGRHQPDGGLHQIPGDWVWHYP